MNTIRHHRSVAAILVGTLALAACGNDSNDADDADASSDTEAPAPTEAPPATEAPSATEAPMETEAPATTGPMAEGDMMGAFGPACSAVPADGEGSFSGMSDDTAATAASNNPVLSTLVGAVGEAGLVDTLNSEGPFTIFAPTNDAFSAIPEDVLNAVLADKDLLTQVLTYHVIPGESHKAADLGAAGEAPTVQEETLSFGEDGTTVTDTGGNTSNVVCSDVPVANGTVHIVDTVLLPQPALDAIASMTGGGEEASADTMGATGPACSAVPADGEGSFSGMSDDTAATAASNNPVLSTLVTAVGEAGLVDTLNGEGPFTIFAPTNDAFDALPEGTLDGLLADTDALTGVLTYHVLPGQLDAQGLIDAGSATTVNGADLTFESAENGAFTINGGSATAVCFNVPTANATVHIIDGVLVPEA